MEKLSVDIHIHICKVGPVHPYCNIYTIGTNHCIFYSSPILLVKLPLLIIINNIDIGVNFFFKFLLLCFFVISSGGVTTPKTGLQWQ